VRYSPKVLGALSRGEGLPPGLRTAITSVHWLQVVLDLKGKANETFDENAQAAQSIISAVPSAVINQDKYTVVSGYRYTLTIRTEEKKLRLIVKINNLLFNTGCSPRNEEIEHRLQDKSPPHP